ncbi:MAG: hypothetical protein AABZ47_01525 [Planctomycetota bacterium]
MFSCAGICLVVLGWRLFPQRHPFADVPDEPLLATPWGCHACGHVVSLTPRQRVELQNQPRKSSSSKGEVNESVPVPDEQTSVRELILRCPKCGENAMHKALTCPRCSAAFPRVLKGVRQTCPQCSFDPSHQPVEKRPSPNKPNDPESEDSE